ncbi:hypothetical protein [Sabulicella rubraurantiaca]|uniref:hypothetical protein n=1 Tax=Sabulicella rubraurantiaca TaxID=2811429 RepID=UPI001A973E70|nr:hypothetical protein [Sabulicella rubraurantiaca]
MGGRSRKAVGTALVLPPLAWFFYQQGMGLTQQLDCSTGGLPVGPAAGLLALLFCAAAAWLGWPVAAEGRKGEMPRFLAWLAIGGAGIFALAILLQAVATFIEPPCWR